MESDDSIQILNQARERSGYLCDMLTRQENELAADGSIDPRVKEAGLIAIRRTIASVRRLAEHADERLKLDSSGLVDSVEKFGKGSSP